MGNYLNNVYEQLDGTALSTLIICAILTSVVVEVIKKLDTECILGDQMIHSLTLLIGVLLASIFSYATQSDWTIYVVVGVASAIMSSGIYEFISKMFGDKK